MHATELARATAASCGIWGFGAPHHWRTAVHAPLGGFPALAVTPTEPLRLRRASRGAGLSNPPREEAGEGFKPYVFDVIGAEMGLHRVLEPPLERLFCLETLRCLQM